MIFYKIIKLNLKFHFDSNKICIELLRSGYNVKNWKDI